MKPKFIVIQEASTVPQLNLARGVYRESEFDLKVVEVT
jgi:hypothetical protein